MNQKKSSVNRPHRPTTLDQLTAATEQEYAHVHTYRIISRRAILTYEANQIEEEIVGLRATIEKARERKAQIAAMLVGLGQAIEKRR